MPLDSRLYRRQNQRNGKPVRWWKAIPCECVDPVTLQSDPSCTLCERDGLRYVEQTLPLGIDGAPLRVLVGETEQDIVTSDFGRLAAGSTKLSLFTDLMPVARLDRVSLLDRFETHREVLVRGGVGEADALLYGPSFRELLEIRQGGSNLMGAPFSIRTIDGACRIEWGAGPGTPPPGSRYSVEYTHFPRFYVAKCILNRGDDTDGLPLPSEWALSLQPPQGAQPTST